MQSVFKVSCTGPGLIPKWPPFYNSFFFLQISLCCLVRKLEIQKNIFPLNEVTRANLQVKKQILKLWPFWNKVYLLTRQAFPFLPGIVSYPCMII